MKTRKIAKNRWPKFLNDFSRVHLGQKASVWICRSNVGLAREAKGLPLVGISADAAQGIDLIVGDSPHDHLSHHIAHPKQLRAAYDDAGHEISVLVDSDEGTITFVKLEQPAQKATPQAFA